MIKCPENLLFASTNKGKYGELKRIFLARNISLLFAGDSLNPGFLPIEPPPDVQEIGNTYLENAAIKAEAFFSWANMPTIADDAGLEVEALNGEPGLYSARYAGENANSEKNIEKLLLSLLGKNNRNARFVSSLVLKIDKSATLRSEGFLLGEITLKPRGRGGFGYDSVFLVRGTGKTLAELKEESPETETHRVMAVNRLFVGSDSSLNPNCLSAS